VERARRGRPRAPSPPAGSDSSLTRQRRVTELGRAMAGDQIDVLVIGGGITGGGVALDAASRGLQTVLIEAQDLAFGTSRWSSKLVHGGLRYLASGDVSLAYECAVERHHLLSRIAPHLVRPAPMVLPLLPGVSNKRAAMSMAGLYGADLLRRVAGTPSSVLPRPRRLDRVRTQLLAPGLPELRGGLEFHDCQLTDDARLVIAVARTAAAYGASMLTRVRAMSIGSSGVSVRDELTGESGVIRARAVITATGVWASTLAPELVLRPSRGTHVVLDSAAVPGVRTNLMMPYPDAHNRYLLLLPQLDGRLYLGLTDTSIEVLEDVPVPPPREIAELIGVLERLLRRPVDPSHVLGAYAGLRPMIADGSCDAGAPTADLSRRHRVLRGDHGAVHVVGGKLTTYRRMAQDAVDLAIEHAGLPAGPCVTENVPLVGAAPAAVLARRAEAGIRLARYGTEAGVVARMEADHPDLAESIAPGVPISHAELRFAVLHEGALTPDDLLDRRFRVGFVPAERTAALPAAHSALVESR